MSHKAEMIGKVFGKLTVLAEAGYADTKVKKLKYTCRCECGTVKDIVGEQLRHETRSCGCDHWIRVAPDIVGQTYHALTVLVDRPPTGPATTCLCRCICGAEAVVLRGVLLGGRRKSCGCLRNPANYKHGHAANKCQTPTYQSWRAMRARCNNPANAKFAMYGAVGIKVCKQWNASRTGFARFLADMGERPEGTTIDRIDGSKG